MKDNFSSQSDKYAQFRPQYPKSIFEFVYQHLSQRQHAWDCGTGNGQIAKILASDFEYVFATDISEQQLAHAYQATNIEYTVQAAETPTFPDQFFDLIVVAQAIHWFDFNKFYQAVRRTARPNALICVLGYSLFNCSPTIDATMRKFYEEVLGNYWDKERRYLDEHYQTIPFPFEEIPTPNFINQQLWTLEHLMGYLNTWSAVKHFIAQNGFNPVDTLQVRLSELWGNQKERLIEFPILMRLGKI